MMVLDLYTPSRVSGYFVSLKSSTSYLESAMHLSWLEKEPPPVNVKTEPYSVDHRLRYIRIRRSQDCTFLLPQVPSYRGLFHPNLVCLSIGS